MHSPREMKAHLEAQSELRTATIEFTRARQTLKRVGGVEVEEVRARAEAERAEKRLRAAEEIVEKLAKRGPPS